MGSEAKQFLALVDAELESRLNLLRENGFTELKEQEAASSEELRIQDRVVTFTAFKESLPDGVILVITQASTQAFFSLEWQSMEKGVVIELDGSVRKATEKELWRIGEQYTY